LPKDKIAKFLEDYDNYAKTKKKGLINAIKIAEDFLKGNTGFEKANNSQEIKNSQSHVPVKKAKTQKKKLKEEPKEIKQAENENQETPIKEKSRIKMRKVGNKQKENSAQLLGSKRMNTESK
jgi:hypothetical protein